MRSRANNLLSQWSSTNLASSINGPWIQVGTSKSLSLSLTWSGTANGAFTVQTASKDDTDKTAPTANFSALDGATYTMSSGTISGDTNLQINIPFAPFNWVRVIWTNTSGSGTLTDAAISVLGE